MDYTTCFDMVMTANSLSVDFDYSGDNEEWRLAIGFKRAQGGCSDVKITVLRNDELAGIREVKMTENESFVTIPFKAAHGDKISYEVMNCTDTTDMVITHLSVSV